jgi:hypothetical protein
MHALIVTAAIAVGSLLGVPGVRAELVGKESSVAMPPRHHLSHRGSPLGAHHLADGGVPIKNTEQQALLGLHRARQGFVIERTAQANQIRGLLTEFGLVIPVGNCGSTGKHGLIGLHDRI